VSTLSDILGFEKFNLKDIWRKVRKDPGRLLLGATDPFSTRMWNQTGIGKDWEPLVDQFGGAYGGSAITLGDTGEGVYGRAREAGVPTEAGAGMHDIAHVIASIFAGGYGADKLGALTGADKLPAGFKNIPMPGGGQSEAAPGAATAGRQFYSAPPQATVTPRQGASYRVQPSLLAARLMRRA
jgi:hypothetical protein